MRFVLIAIGLCLGITIPRLTRAEERPHALGLGPDLYFDNGTAHRSSLIGQQLDERDDDISSDGLFSGQVYFLTHVLEQLRVGGSFRYLGSYSYTIDEDGDDPEAVELGNFMEFSALVEYLVPIVDQFDLALGAHAGLALVIPGGELDDTIDSLQARGYDTWSTPRIGYLVGPQLGGRYAIFDWLAVRADLALSWQQLFLLDSSIEQGGFRGEEDWGVKWLRVRPSVAAEIQF